MIFTDLRHYVATLEKLGQLKVLEGASCELEIGAITEMATSQANSPAVLFDSIQGHKKGYRVLTNFLAQRPGSAWFTALTKIFRTQKR